MAYEPTAWKSGDVVTSAKLNKLEQGVANTVFIVTLSYDEETNTYSLDQQYADIVAAYEAGANLFCSVEEGAPLHGMTYMASASNSMFVVTDIFPGNIGSEGANVYIRCFYINADGTITVREGEYALTPFT